MTLTKAKEIIAQLLEDFPALEVALDGAPMLIDVPSKLAKCQEFAKKVLPRPRRREIDAACLAINHHIQISSYN